MKPQRRSFKLFPKNICWLCGAGAPRYHNIKATIAFSGCLIVDNKDYYILLRICEQCYTVAAKEASKLETRYVTSNFIRTRIGPSILFKDIFFHLS